MWLCHMDGAICTGQPSTMHCFLMVESPEVEARCEVEEEDPEEEAWCKVKEGPEV